MPQFFWELNVKHFSGYSALSKSFLRPCVSILEVLDVVGFCICACVCVCRYSKRQSVFLRLLSEIQEMSWRRLIQRPRHDTVEVV